MPKPSLPRTAVLEMTYRCNHACLFCSCPWFAENFAREDEIEVDEWKAVIDELHSRNVCDMAFTGGEPLLKEGLFDIIRHAAGRGISTHLLSNGRIMSDDVLQFCAEHKVQLSMSLPGLETFREHTGSDTNPHDVLDWIRKSQEAGIATVAGITITNRNLGELFETMAEALLAGADSILLNRFMPGGRGLQHRDYELNREQLTEMLDTAEEVLRTANRFGHVGTELPHCVIEPSKYKHLQVGTRCSAAVGFFVVDPSGYIRVCNHSEHRLLYWRELDQVMQHPYWKRFTEKSFLPPYCLSCEHSFRCDGGCREAAHIVGGKLESLDPLLVLPIRTTPQAISLNDNDGKTPLDVAKKWGHEKVAEYLKSVDAKVGKSSLISSLFSVCKACGWLLGWFFFVYFLLLPACILMILLLFPFVIGELGLSAISRLRRRNVEATKYSGGGYTATLTSSLFPLCKTCGYILFGSILIPVHIGIPVIAYVISRLRRQDTSKN